MIRTATPADAAAIAAIWNPIIRDTAVTFTTEEKTETGLAALIESAPACLVSQTDGKVTGFALYTQFRNGPGYARTMELTVHLAPEVRGQGQGRALVEGLVECAHTQGIGTLWAGIAGENPASVAFHERLGFVTTAILPSVGFKFGRWMDLTLMYRAIAAPGLGATQPLDDNSSVDA